ncbi:MAG: B12-binding domain-containing radical SAM protein [Candidatus Margulisbacteria bacterium]|nr:B12-binding domain-containing radical SAM protein [Candidatus Margulisiibacteriota bacterium]MBU1616425.1 B12-binding domain-containing radical SAM protein [Candidatus Margulisiibacteriota bacterium]
MKLLFVYMNATMRGSFPIGLTNLASYLKSLGHEIEIFDTTFYRQYTEKNRNKVGEKFGLYKPIENPVVFEYLDSDAEADLHNKIRESKPDLIGFSILSANYYHAIKWSRKIKEVFPGLPVIYGGLHPSICPDQVIAEPSVDMICLGEGEYALDELLRRLDKKQDITDVRNLWVKQNGQIYKNPLRELISLDKLPVLDWSFFSEQHIYAPLNGRMRRIGSVEFSRGCPYSCNYCSCTALRNLTAPQKYLRHKTIDRAIEDLIVLKDKYKVEMFYFLDETFLSMEINLFKDLAKIYKREVGLPFYAMTHPFSVTEEKAKIVDDMGCYLMTIGIEVGNEKFRGEVLNRRVPNTKIIEAFDIFHNKTKVLPSAFAMIGLPFETRELIFDTIELFRRCKPATYSVGIFQPFMGSKLRQVCIDNGFFDPTGDIYEYPSETSVLTMPQLSKAEIEKLYRTFMLYTKVDKNLFPLVKKAEDDDVLLAELISQYQQGKG